MAPRGNTRKVGKNSFNNNNSNQNRRHALAKPTFPAQNLTIKFNKSGNNHPQNHQNQQNSKNRTQNVRKPNENNGYDNGRQHNGPIETDIFVGDFTPYFITTADMKNFKKFCPSKKQVQKKMFRGVCF